MKFPSLGERPSITTVPSPTIGGVLNLLICLSLPGSLFAQEAAITLNHKADGYRGIWYMNQPSNDEYVYKYSGGLGTYCAKHKPFAIHAPQVNKTFFCYGGALAENSQHLLHMVAYFDHATKRVSRPTILLDKQTDDAHDNPVLSIDNQGYIWIFSTSHGRSRPSYIHRSRQPFDIEEFEQIAATRLEDEQRIAIDNFSYMQVWHADDDRFHAFFTRYNYPAARTICYMNSRDGIEWSPWQRIAAIDQGHYQVSGVGKSRGGTPKLATMFNYHPAGKGLNWRTNLYYLETIDAGQSWQSIDGTALQLPLNDPQNAALVYDYQSDGKNVYLKDLRIDSNGHPLLLYITSGGYQAGPQNDPRDWRLARWDGSQWIRSTITQSDNNYDMGELWLVAADDWRIIAPTTPGPQAYNPGGEIAMWQSRDLGMSWHKLRQLTADSPMNHTYVRRVLEAHPDFVSLWADGHGRQPSQSRLYFSNLDGDVFQLPEQMSDDTAPPIPVSRPK